MANTNLQHLIPKRNPETQARHRREVIWQVFIPMVGGTAVLLGACVLPVAVVIQGGEVRRWADMSVMWLAVPVLVLSLIPLGLLGGAVYGLAKLLGALPGWMYQAQDVFDQLLAVTVRAADWVVEPVIRWQSFRASLAKVLPKRRAPGR